MLSIIVPAAEFYDERTEKFVVTKDFKLEFEHSLVSLSKWEAKWETPFIGKAEKTTAQLVSYLKMMIVTPDVPEEVFLALTEANYKEVQEYIDAKMTATWFAPTPDRVSSREIITSEIIYYWMIALNIPFECETWHLNRLLTLIKVCNEKNSPDKKRKMTPQQLAARNRALNEQRKAALNTKG